MSVASFYRLKIISLKTKHGRDLQFGKHSNIIHAVCERILASDFNCDASITQLLRRPAAAAAVRFVQRATAAAIIIATESPSTSIKQISNTASIIMPHANECVCRPTQRASRKHVNGLCDVINSSSPT
jgi:hypothetical protein